MAKHAHCALKTNPFLSCRSKDSVMAQFEERFVSGHGFFSRAERKATEKGFSRCCWTGKTPAAEAVQTCDLGGIAEAKP
jgi:hypothetical protein